MQITSITLNNVEFEVNWKHHKAIRGSRDSFGVPLEPDEPEEIELLCISFADDPQHNDITDLLSASCIAQIHQSLHQWMADYKADRD